MHTWSVGNRVRKQCEESCVIPSSYLSILVVLYVRGGGKRRISGTSCEKTKHCLAWTALTIAQNNTDTLDQVLYQKVLMTEYCCRKI